MLGLYGKFTSYFWDASYVRRVLFLTVEGTGFESEQTIRWVRQQASFDFCACGYFAQQPYHSTSSSLRKGMRFNVSKQWVSIYCQCGMCSTLCVKRRVERKRGEPMRRRTFSMSRGLLLIRYCACVLVWALLSKYSIYCITLFSDSTNCNTNKPSMEGGRFPSSFTRWILILSVLTGVKQSRDLADQTVPPLLVFIPPYQQQPPPPTQPSRLSTIS